MTEGPLELAETAFGEGAPFVVLHGLLGRARNWQAIAKSLAAGGHEVILVDLRNHGASPWSDVMDYPAMAADVAALIERRAGGRASVLGHSMGGKVAIQLALTRPELVARVIAADIAPVPYAHGDEFGGYLRAMLDLDLAAVRRRADADAALAATVPEPAIRSFLLQNFAPGDESRPSGWQPNLRVLLEALPRITGFPEPPAGTVYDGPAAAIRGGRSAYVGPEGEAALRRFLPRVAVHTLPDAGHWLHAEQPAAFLTLLRACLG